MNDSKALNHKIQRNQLAELGKRALTAYGIDQAKLQFVTDSENTVFRVDTPSQTYALRIHPPDTKTVSEIEGELHWLRSLQHDTALNVPEPVQLLDGQLVQILSTKELSQPRPIVLFHWLPGELLGDHFNPELATQLGVVMAQLHDHALGFTLPSNTTRLPWERDGGATMIRYLKQSKGLSTHELRLCIAAAEKSGQIIVQVNDPHNYGLIHCDLHTWNCLLHQDEINVIDFDDCRPSPFIEDIAISLASFDEYANQAVLQDHFLNGYTNVRPLPVNFETDVEAFITSRSLGLICWVLSWPSIDHQPFGRAMLANSLARIKTYME